MKTDAMKAGAMKAAVTQVSGPAALLARDDVDTDAIFPARFLRLVQREGMAAHLFADWRDAGRPELGFLSWRPAVRVLVVAHNFGCGSSREQAVWALADQGVQAIVALSFGDIFRNNCVKNNLVAATLAPAAHQALVQSLQAAGPSGAAGAPGATLQLDIASRQLLLPGAGALHFELADGHAEQLMSEEDEIGRTLHHAAALLAHEQRVAAERPWLTAVSV